MHEFERLVSLRMWGAARTLDLQGFQFGKSREVPVTVGPRKGSTKTVGELALHLQCLWRLSRAGHVLVGSNDEGEFACYLLQKLLDGAEYSVETATCSENGHICIRLTNNLKFEARPFDGYTREAWRLFRPSSDEPHLVYPEPESDE